MSNPTLSFVTAYSLHFKCKVSTFIFEAKELALIHNYSTWLSKGSRTNTLLTEGPQVLREDVCPVQSQPDVRAPPIMAASPLTERAICVAEERRQAHPLLRPALQADRPRGPAGVRAPHRPPASCMFERLPSSAHILFFYAPSWF